MHNMDESSLLAICMMTDGRYVTLPLDKMQLAFKRVLEAEYIMSVADCKECHALYIAAICDTTALELRLAKCVFDYNESMQVALIARVAKLEAARARTRTKPPAIPKVTMGQICRGTSVSMFFTWEDLGIDAQQPRKCEAKNGAYDKAGEWRTGTINDIVKN